MPDTEEFLAHYGVKGMKWGVRRAKKKAARTEKKERRQDRKWLMTTHKNSINRASEIMNSGVQDAINKKHPNANLLNNSNPRANAAYKKAVASAYETALNKAISESNVSNKGEALSPNGWYKASFGVNPTTLQPQLFVKTDPEKKQQLTHTSSDTSVGTVPIKLDTKGKIVGFESIELTMEHSADSSEEFLAHYGVKGMRWGVRKSKAERRNARKSRSAKLGYSAIKHRSTINKVAAGAILATVGGVALSKANVDQQRAKEILGLVDAAMRRPGESERQWAGRQGLPVRPLAYA